ncbi:response regulator transcription factor [Akkermansiaceae bacterium]|nr:response regulator transcription factor [Akkermansiaceae bacterium]
MLEIALIEDHYEFREALREEIDAHEGFCCQGAYGSVPAALEAIGRERFPDILVLDLGLPIVDGLAALPDLRKAMPRTKILVLTISEDRVRVLEALAAGANGYLLKTDPMERIIQGIANIARGEAPMSPAIAEIVLRTFQKSITPGLSEILTTRELEVLQSLSEGQPRKIVASELGISENTVNNHVRHIYEKLNVNNLSGALKKAAEGGLI